MVRFGKNKLKALNKLSKKQKVNTTSASNKVIKKKLNAEKKVSFQKEVLLKEALTEDNILVKAVTAKDITLKAKSKTAKKKSEGDKKPKLKPVEKQKKRQKTMIQDAKLLMKLMKKNC